MNVLDLVYAFESVSVRAFGCVFGHAFGHAFGCVFG